ncbi:MAG: tetratricopeptide repeat protein [Bacteroidales bacterium]|nr:tetratricopeptide repeat protein [Bacteroidales bacterium]
MLLNSFKILFALCIVILTMASCNNSELKVSSDKNQNAGMSQQNSTSMFMESPEALETMLKTDSLNLETRLKTAAIYYTNNNFDKAIYHYLIVNRIDKDNLAALFNLGNIYYDIQRNEEAVKYYEQFLKLEKNNTNVRCDLATCYMNLNNTEKAISLLRENIKIDFNHAQSHYNLSVMLKLTGKTADAEEELKIYNAMVQDQAGQSK